MLTHELVPATTPGSKDLMVVLHGLGDSMEGYRFLPQLLGVPALNYLLVNAPDEYYGGYQWYSFPGDPDAEIRRSRTQLFELLDAQWTAGFTPERTFVFGFSQGCLMAVEAGMRYARRLAGIVGVSGYVHNPDQILAEQSATAKEQHFLITHGLHDPLIPFAGAKAHFDQLAAAGMKIEWHAFPKEHTIHGEAEVRVIREFVLRRLAH